MRQNITQDGLVKLFESLDGTGHKYIYIGMRTTPSLTKKHRTTGESLEVALNCLGIVKESEGVYSIGLIYENAVNNKLEREGFERNFEVGELKWGKWVPGSKIFLTHTSKGETEEKLYVRLYMYLDNKLCKECRETVYYKVLADGSEVEMSPTELEKAKGFLPIEKEKEALVEGASLDAAKPIVNSVKVENFTYVKIGGVEYTVK